MTLTSALIQQAYREGNLIPVGSVPTTAELTEGLDGLNRLMFSALGIDFGEVLSDWLVPQPQRTSAVAANYPQSPLAINAPSSVFQNPPSNSHIVWNGTTQTVWFPDNPRRGSRMSLTQASGFWDGDPNTPKAYLTLDGNGLQIEDAATLVLDNDVSNMQWFYRQSTGSWRRVVDAVLTDEWLFSSDMDDYWILMLAFRLAGRYGKTMSRESAMSLQWIKGVVRQRYRQTQDTVYNGDQIPGSLQSYGSTWGWP